MFTYVQFVNVRAPVPLAATAELVVPAILLFSRLIRCICDSQGQFLKVRSCIFTPRLCATGSDLPISIGSVEHIILPKLQFTGSVEQVLSFTVGCNRCCELPNIFWPCCISRGPCAWHGSEEGYGYQTCRGWKKLDPSWLRNRFCLRPKLHASIKALRV